MSHKHWIKPHPSGSLTPSASETEEPRPSKSGNRFVTTLHTQGGAISDGASTKLATVKELVRDGDASNKELAESIFAEHVDEANSSSILLQLEIAFYFDNIGDAHRAVQIADMAVDLTQTIDDINLQRKAHNTAGLLFSRVCDFEQACFHLEQALLIARKLNNEFLEFAVLCNVVSTLQMMGLQQDAKRLALKLSQRAEGTQELDYLHLQNALNGIRLSEYMRDVESANYFFSIAKAKVASAGPVSSNWKAFIDSCYALCLLQQGKPDQAFCMISKAIEEWGSFENSRVSATLYCAFGACALMIKNKEQVERSKKVLAELLASCENYASDREDVLRTLVELHLSSRNRKDKKVGLMYLRQLNDHIVTVKHKQFYESIRRASGSAGNTLKQVSRPSYRLPSAIAVATSADNYLLTSTQKPMAINSEEVQEKHLRLFHPSRKKLEERLRSDDFNVAEDWAVAADFASARPRGNCFEVGTLSGLIASQAGFSAERCMLIEMACRLHDIGKVAANAKLHSAVNSGAQDSYLAILEHSQIGAGLLGSSRDVVLQLASRIARHHHEWWNGCGLPSGLAGETIPIEARICLIADAYLDLLRPSEPQVPWDVETALQQVVSMAGVQLDPNLIAPFLLAVDVYLAAAVDKGDREKPFELNSLIIAKQQLLNAVKLVS